MWLNKKCNISPPHKKENKMLHISCGDEQVVVMDKTEGNPSDYVQASDS